MGFIGLHDKTAVETFPFMAPLKNLPAQCKSEIVRLISRMIKKEPDERASAEALLGDPFFGALPSRDQAHAILERLSRSS
ncbi:hypothetical protein [Paracidovorax konjaci]|nr:hypothetical protein [Paracidovorax konjaci]